MNTKKEKLLNDTYYKWMEIGLYDLPLDGANDFVDPEIMGYGTAIDEKVLSISDYRKLINTQREQAVGLKMSFEINSVFRNISNKEDSAIFVDEIKVSIILQEGKQELFLRMTTILEYIDNKWIVLHWHGSMPTETTAETDTWLINEWKRKNEKLQKLVDEKTSELLNKNKELEIETALEKVRSSALAMKEPADMLEVCRIISDQLHILGVNDIRNIQTAIIDEEKSFYLNYQYFTAYDRSAIELAEYNKHPKVREMAETMKRSANAFFSQSFDCEELNVFREYRKQDNQFPDPILEESTSLHFYFYSIGPGALGISTYNSTLSESDMGLFKRFRNVFELAYRRFLDIQQAEAQAREAQIEASLERVRAVAMGMNKSDDLLSICEVSFKDLKKLGFDNIRNVLIHIQYDNQKYFMDYDFSDLTGGAITKIEYGSHPVVEDYLKQIRSAKDAFYQGVIEKDQLEEWKDFRRNSGQINDPRLDKATALYYYFFSIGIGDIGISTLKSIDESQIKILKRFRNVFALSYQRYIDISNAEAQAREAKIEAALEKIRSRALAMRNSSEVGNVSTLLFSELEKMDINPSGFSIMIFDEEQDKYELWRAKEVAHQGAYETFSIKAMYDKFDKYVPGFGEELKSAWAKGDTFFVCEFRGEKRVSFLQANREMANYSDEVFEKMKNGWPDPTCWHLVFFKYGWFGVLQNEQLIKEDLMLIQRFAEVFDFAYTRFLDLQKAESQAREAKIEAALEKVRGRAMAMRSSEDLGASVNVFFKELKNLGFLPRRCGVAIIDEARRSAYNMITTAGNIGDFFEITGDVNLDSHFVLTNMLLNWKVQQDYFLELDTKQMEEYYRILRPQVAVTNFNDVRQYGYYLHFKEGMFYVWMDKELQVNDLQIFRRFTQVIGLTYRRHLDLQKAETQAREAQIEAALERVRSRTMAMQRSDELSDTAAVLFQEIKKISNEELIQLTIGNYNETAGLMEFRVTSWAGGGEYEKRAFNLSIEEPIVLKPAFTAWKQKKKSIVFDLTGEQLKEWLKYRNENSGVKVQSADTKGRRVITVAFFSKGHISLSSPLPLSAETIQLLERFAIVFDGTYTRFLDLQNAEAQARESQIEAALERVRSRSMAMYNSADLGAVVFEMFTGLLKLDAQLDRCIIMIVDSQTLGINWYLSGKEGLLSNNGFLIQNNSHPSHQAYLDGWRTKRKKWQYHLAGEEKKHWDSFGFSQTGLAQLPDFIKADMSAVESIHLTISSDDFGCLIASSLSPLSEAHASIVDRFTTVFNQTYTRFLDLQKAEAQAREAQIEAALEKVRSRSMAMQKSEELKDVIQVVYEQFVHLKINVDHAGFVVDYKPKGNWHFWIADERDIPSKIKHPYFESVWANQFNEAKEKGANFFATNLNFEEKNKFYNELLSYVPGLPEASKDFYLSCPGLAASTVLFDNVSLYIENFSTIPYSDEENKILMRFGNVFQQTYTRFLDLQRAEAQNKIIQSENDRKTKELEDARQLQLAMLPRELPKIPHLDITVYMKTATEVGGDYYDFNVDANGTLTVLVGDATGHGMMSGMMVSIMKSFFISNKANIELKQFFENSNNSIKDMQLGRLMMGLIGIQITTEKIIATNAGMPSLLYFRNKSQKAGEFVSNNLPLGGMKGTQYLLKEINYEKGDTLLLMSDGFAELKNSQNEQYGYVRIKEIFRSLVQKSSSGIIEELKTAASQWTNGAEPDDDITFVVIKVK